MTVQEYLNLNERYKASLTQLRGVFLDLGLNEVIKWNFPVYTSNGKNITGLGAFNSYFGIWFFQGALLKDEAQVLTNAQEGKTQAMRQWRFQPDEDLDIDLIKCYVLEAIDNQYAGLEVKPQKKPLVVPHELKRALKENSELIDKFEELSLSQKREYSEYISEAKRPETKTKRLEKIIPMILDKIGLHDKYR